MNWKNILSWFRKDKTPKEITPLLNPVSEKKIMGPFRQEMDQLFEKFSSPFLKEHHGFIPKINVSENENTVEVTTEIPGMDQKDIQLTLSNGMLTIKGEKREEQEEKGKDYYHIERTFGSFQRIVHLPWEVDDKKINASMKNGVLRVILPKTAQTQTLVKQIEIKEVK